MGFIYRLALLLVSFHIAVLGNSQAAPQQYPLLIQKAFFGVDMGYINYPFTSNNLTAGNSAQTVQVPHIAPRLTLFGYHFTKNLWARITYMRPVQWVLYKNLNGDDLKHSVWMNVGEFTVKENIPLSKKLSFFGEAGLALITRNGFDVNNSPVISDANYSTVSIGGGMEYHLNRKWDLNIYSSYSPGKSSIKQPHTVFAGAGFTYNMNPLPVDPSFAKERHAFPSRLVQLSYTTNSLGYGVNHFFAEGKVPVFWGGLAEVEQGWSFNYRRNVFQTKKTFSLDIGTSVGSWESNATDNNFYAVSVYLLMRFDVVRTKLCDYYFFYSVAGPTYLSKTVIDGHDTGKHFTFRDYMGIGGFAGPNKELNMELSIGHFSNGNLFPNNAAVKIPLTFSVGYAFK